MEARIIFTGHHYVRHNPSSIMPLFVIISPESQKKKERKKEKRKKKCKIVSLSLQIYSMRTRFMVYSSVFETLKLYGFCIPSTRTFSGLSFLNPFLDPQENVIVQSRIDYQHYVRFSWQSAKNFLRYKGTNGQTSGYAQSEMTTEGPITLGYQRFSFT